MARKPKHPAWSSLTDEEKASYLQDARRRGGRARAAQPSMAAARSKGGTVRCQQPSMALARSKGYWALWNSPKCAYLLVVKSKLSKWNQAQADAHQVPFLVWKERRFAELRQTYKRLG
jgi:hypothetical protein